MNINDQQLVDHLYNQIFTQQTRFNYFNKISTQHVNSVWNKTSDENEILKNMVEHYKKYYINKTLEIKVQLENNKNDNISSYLTYDPKYYIDEYNSNIEDIDKYISKLKLKNIDNIDEDFSQISENVDKLFPSFLKIPTLLGQLSQNKCKDV